MISENELLTAIEECEREPVTSSKVSKLADFLIVYDHFYGLPNSTQYVEASQPLGKTIEINGETEFLKAINGKDAEKVFKVIDEMAELIRTLHPRAFDSAMSKILDI